MQANSSTEYIDLTEDKVNKPLHIVGHLGFVALFSLAFYFFKERYFADVSFYLCQIINTGHLDIEHGRYIGAVSQIWPLICLKLQLPIKVIMLSYTLGDVLYYYLLFNILLYGLKDEKSAIALIISLIVGVSYLFFCPVSEIVQGLALLFVFNSMLNQKKQANNTWFLVMCFILVTVVWSHPLSFIATTIILLRYILAAENKKEQRFWLLVIVVVTASIAKFILLDNYDSVKMGYNANPQNKIYMQLFHLNYLKAFVAFFYKEYWMLVVFTFITITYYIKEKNYLKAIVYFLSALAIPLLILATHWEPFYISNYTERMYWSAVPIIVLPFMLDASSWFKNKKKWLVIMLLSMMTTQLNVIYNLGTRYQARTIQLENIIASTNDKQGDKFIWDEKNIGKTYSEVGWALPEETMLLSSLQGKTKTIILKEDAVADNNYLKLNANNILYSNNSIYKAYRFKEDTALNQSYFKLKHIAYQNLNSAICNDTSDTFTHNIFITLSSILTYKPKQNIYLPIQIKNANKKSINSGIGMPCSACVSYHWYKGPELVKWQGVNTPLEVDIAKYYKQDIIVEMPAEKGKYTLVVDLKIGEKWCNINTAVDLTID